MILENFYHTILARIGSWLSGRNWLWKLTFFSVGLSLFLAFPPYHLFLKHLDGTSHLDAWTFIESQSHNLLQPEGFDLGVRRDNMIFRWTLPLLSFLTGHNLVLILILQATLGVFFIYWIGSYIFKLTGDKVTTALFVLSVSNIFVGTWHFAEVHGYGDGIAYFCLLAAMLHPNRIVMFFTLMAAFFTDERAVLAGGFVLLWNIVNTAYTQNSFDWKNLFRSAFRGRNLVIWAAWAIYLSIRLYVQSKYFQEHTYSTVGSPVVLEQAHRNGLGSSIWGVFEGVWLLLLACGVVIWLTRKYMIGLMLLTGLIVLIISGIYVHDIDRSLSYGFPLLFIAFFVLYHTASRAAFQLLLFFCAVVCISHPQIFYMGYNQIIWLEPFPMKVLLFLDKIYSWHLFD